MQVDDHVTTKGGHTGYIRYIGHVDSADQSQAQALFVGLELDSAGSVIAKSAITKNNTCNSIERATHYSSFSSQVQM